jgi:hypothetical protein
MATQISCLILSGLLFLGSVPAQDDNNTDHVVGPIGSRINRTLYAEVRPVGIIRPADFVSQLFALSSDTRDKTLRQSEMQVMLKAIIDGAGDRFQVQASNGLLLTSANYKFALSDANNSDSSHVDLQLRASLAARAEHAFELVETMRRFLLGSKRVGRAALVLGDGYSLTINEPERFRPEVISQIVNDLARVKQDNGDGCKVTLEKFDAKLKWDQVAPGNLYLYIPYTLSFADCHFKPR